jgi:hypothetical protein
MENKYDIFISYASEDKKLAFAICHYLEEYQLRCWIAPRDIPKGALYQESIVGAIKSSKIMVVVFTEYANISPFVPKEVERAVSNQIPVLPFRTKDILPSEALELFLSSVNWLDAIDGKAENYFNELYTHCSALLNLEKPIPAPRPVPYYKKYMYYLIPIIIIIITAVVLLLPTHVKPPDESAVKQAQLTRLLVADMGIVLAQINDELGSIGKSDKQMGICVRINNNDFNEIKKETVRLISHYQGQMVSFAGSAYLNKNIDNSNIPVIIPLDEVKELYSKLLPGFKAEVKNYYDHNALLLSKGKNAWPKDIESLLELNRKSVFTYSEIIYYSFHEILSLMPDSLKKDFDKVYPSLGNFPNTVYMSRDEATRQKQQAEIKYKNIQVDISGITGHIEKGAEILNEDYDKQNAVSDKLQKSSNELQNHDKQLSESYKKLIEDCKFDKNDNENLMWNKIQYLAAIGLYDYVSGSLDKYLEYNKLNDPGVSVYVNCAKDYYKRLVNDTSKQGILVSKTSGGQTLKTGDIILSMDGQRIHYDSEFKKLNKSVRHSIVSLHLDNNMNWKKQESLSSNSNTDIQVRNLKTKLIH